MKPSWLYNPNSKEQPQKDMNKLSRVLQMHHEARLNDKVGQGSPEGIAGSIVGETGN
jgi:hypothetical protein